MNLIDCKKQEYDRLKMAINSQERMLRDSKNNIYIKNLKRFILADKRKLSSLHAEFGVNN